MEGGSEVNIRTFRLCDFCYGSWKQTRPITINMQHLVSAQEVPASRNITDGSWTLFQVTLVTGASFFVAAAKDFKEPPDG